MAVMVPASSYRDVTSAELRIDELILAGVPASEGYRIANAVERELTVRLSQEGLPPTLRRAGAVTNDRVDGGAISLTAGGRSESIGAQLGRAIYQGLASGQPPQGKRN